MSAKYLVHRFDLCMTADQSKLEQFLNSLGGESIGSPLGKGSRSTHKVNDHETSDKHQQRNL